MYLKTLTLTNFKCFGQYNVEFPISTTLFQGENGSGKSSIIEAIFFVLYGFTSKDLISDLPTRGKSKSCTAGLVIEDNGHIYHIVRQFPLKIEIKVDGKALKLSTAEANQYIIDNFGSRLAFSKFRLLDTYNKETNFLEEGPTALKKILFSGMDDTFNIIKTNLTELKNKYERYNRDSVVVPKCYPSTKRLSKLRNAISKFSLEKETLNSAYRTASGKVDNIIRQQSSLKTKIKDFTERIKKTEDSGTCYVCGQALKTKESLIAEWTNVLTTMQSDLENYNLDLDYFADERNKSKEIYEKYLPSNLKYDILIKKLEDRIKMKDYVYTDKDVAVVKQALIELDILSSHYLTETVKNLEPVINSILSKINLTCSFEVDNKGKFGMSLLREGNIFKYKDLSGGEKFLMQIAIKLALLLSQNKTGLLIADEGLSSLDENNLNHILSIVENLPYQLLLVLHRAEGIIDKVNVITLEKGAYEKN